MILEPFIMEYKNDKHGFQPFFNVCDFSVWRVASFGHVLYFSY